jgi:hypothetical protein
MSVAALGAWMANIRAIGIVWFRREDYQRVRDMSDDEMHPTFDEFETNVTERLKSMGSPPPGIIFEKVIVDPDELLVFARENYGGKINSEVRGEFVARKVAEKYGTNH